MNTIELKLEIQDKYGNVIKVFSKPVESSYTPSKEMVFSGDGYILTARNVYFDLDDGTILVRFVETPNKDEINGWDFLEREGWVLL